MLLYLEERQSYINAQYNYRYVCTVRECASARVSFVGSPLTVLLRYFVAVAIKTDAKLYHLTNVLSS